VNYTKWKQLLCPFPILIEIPSSTIDTAVHEMQNTQSIGVKNPVDSSELSIFPLLMSKIPSSTIDIGVYEMKNT